MKRMRCFLLICLFSAFTIPVQSDVTMDIFMCDVYTLQMEYWCEQGHVAECRRYIALAEDQCGS